MESERRKVERASSLLWESIPPKERPPLEEQNHISPPFPGGLAWTSTLFYALSSLLRSLATLSIINIGIGSALTTTISWPA